MPANVPEKPKDPREVSRFDRKLLERYADGESVEEIAAHMPGDMTPAMVGFRIKQLLASRSGLLNIAEEAALHLFDLQRLKKKAWGMLDQEEGNRALTGLANVMQQIGMRIDAAAIQSEEMMGKIRKAQAREFAATLELAYDGVIRRLSEKYPEMEKPVLREIFGSEFEKAVGRIDKLVEPEDNS
jgi:PAS domain-containing protein